MNRRDSLKMLGLMPAALPLIASEQSQATALTPLPNCKKFGVDAYLDPENSGFHYHGKNKPSVRDWISSFCKPLDSLSIWCPNRTSLKEFGYYVNSRILDANDIIWNDNDNQYASINEVWGRIPIWLKESRLVSGKEYPCIQRMTIYCSFDDRAAPVYDHTPEDRRKFWKHMLSDYIKIS